jgi:hypothetical protein
MPKIKCPHCGLVQEWYPHILLCNKCFEDISGSADWRATEPDVPSAATGKPRTAAIAFGTSMRESLRMGRWLSPLGTILKRTAIRILKRFLTLYFFSFLSLFFLMAIGIFTSMIGINMFFPEAVPPTQLMLPVMLTGIAAFLFISLFCQAALISALVNEQAGLMDSFAIASGKVLSYTALFLVLTVLIWGGFMFMYIPGVIALVLFSFSPLILISENESVLGSLRKNIQYLSGMWVPMLLRFVPVALFMIAVLFLYAYGGSYILFNTMVLGTKNEFLYPLMASAIFSPFIVIFAVYAFTVYEDLRNAWEGPVRRAADVPLSAGIQPAVDLAAVAGLAPLGAYLNAAWAVYRHRFGTLMLLNVISYIPHILQLSVLLAGLFLLARLIDILGIRGEFGLLWLTMILRANPVLMYIFIGGCVLFILIHLAMAFVGFYLYIVLELAFVYAVADEGISALGALRKAKKRFSRFVWVQLYTDLTISMSFALVIPGIAFTAWYSLTPYVFALEGEETVAFRKSRQYVARRLLAVLKRLYSIALLPAMTAATVMLIITAFLPFYWISGMFYWIFSGKNLPGMLLIYSAFFWEYFLIALALGTALFYVPFQKVLLYVLYRDVVSSRGS